jgi:hypothetical protein
MNRRYLVRGCVIAAALVAGGLAMHVNAQTLPNGSTPVDGKCTPNLPKGYGECGNAVRPLDDPNTVITPAMLANSEAFANCMGNHGMRPIVYTTD